MASDAPTGPRGPVERARDALVGTLAFDGRRAAVDLAAVATWVFAVAAVLHGTGLPSWLYYALVVVGVAAHSTIAARAESLAAKRASRREHEHRS